MPPVIAEPDSSADSAAGLPPCPAGSCPLSEDSFVRLSAAWRRLGFWLSVWTLDGGLATHDRDGPRFWTLALRGSSSLRDQFAGIVRGALAACASDRMPTAGADQQTPRIHTGNAADEAALSADCGAVILVAVIRAGSSAAAGPGRPRGVCLAARPPCASDDPEALQRFCDRHGLDARVLLGARAERALPRDEVDALRDVFEGAVRVEAATGRAAREIDSLTRNLDATYEELKLVYRIGAQLIVAQDAPRVLRHLADQILDISRTAGLAFILAGTADELPAPGQAERRPERLHDPPPAARDLDPVARQTNPRCVTVVGCGSASAADLERLNGELCRSASPDAPHILVDATADPRWAWAAGWLRHAVALPLYSRGRSLGTMLAINCTDGRDFDSIEIQLLRSIADQVASFLHNERLYGDLADLLMGLLHALVSSIDAKDPYTCGHSERVAYISRRLGEAAGLLPVEAQRVYLAGLLHDVGKIGVPDAVLLKPGRLTDEEFTCLKKHPEIGARILAKTPQVHDLIPGVVHHHERMDGRGYPGGLRGKDIPRLARILCLADCLDAMTTTRTYRACLPPTLAVAEVRRCAGTQFDPGLAEILLSLDIPSLLKDAHVFAGSRLPGVTDDNRSEGPIEASFAARPIFSREMFIARVTEC